MQIPEYYPPILADIAQLMHLRLRESLPADQAECLALALTDDLCQTFSGCQMYIPKRDMQQRLQRDQAIVREFTGNNRLELAKRYKLSVTQIYDILARQRHDRQPPLF